MRIKTLALALLLWPTTTFADVIAPTDLGAWFPFAGSLVAAAYTEEFHPAPPAVASLGTLTNEVYFNDVLNFYTYTHTVLPSHPNVQFFNAGFDVRGFTGTAGWQFSESAAAGGAGIGDFFMQGAIGSTSPIGWTTTGALWHDWDAGEPITFFFVSTLPPELGGLYNLTAGATGTAESFAPTPEPASLLLFGSGLAAFYYLRRRTRRA